MLGNILAVGLMSLGMGLSGVKDEPKMYAQDSTTYTITYNPIGDYLERLPDILEFLAENNYVVANELSITGTIVVNDTSETLVGVYKDSSDNVHWKTAAINYYYAAGDQLWYNAAHQTSTVTSIEVTSQEYYEALAEPEPSMGNDIIGTIASGLGIIGALATTFLTGFGNLFYTAGNLTPFAIFSLVMLGIAVSFAVVKLVLALIRSNTGA